MTETSGEGGVNLIEVLQKQEEQYKTIDEPRLSIHLLTDQLKSAALQQGKREEDI